MSKLKQAIANELGRPYFIAEIGMNHNGDFQECMELMKLAKDAGADCVKFQKRTPEMHVMPSEWGEMRSSPAGANGQATKLAHRKYMEFNSSEMARIRSFARQLDIEFFFSVFDIPSAALMDSYREVVAIKVPSPMNHNRKLVEYVADLCDEMDVPLIASYGMSDGLLSAEVPVDLQVVKMHTVSCYPTPPDQCHIVNVDGDNVIGYSGHEEGFAPTVLAVKRGARIIERHFTRSREQPGSDHKSSLDPEMFGNMVQHCTAAHAQIVEMSEMLGQKRTGPYECERAAIERLR